MPVDIAVATANQPFSEAQFFLLLSFALMLMQVVYRVWDKRDSQALLKAFSEGNREILNAVLKAFSEGTKEVLCAINANNQATVAVFTKTSETLLPHLERSRKILGVVQELQAMHNVRDEDGRFIWYMPKEIIETQRELTKLTQVVASTQERIAKIGEKQEETISALASGFKDATLDHRDRCSRYFLEIKKELEKWPTT